MAIFAVLLAVIQAPTAVAAKISDSAAASRQNPSILISSIAALQSSASPTTHSEGGEQNYPHVTGVNPPPYVPPWTLHEQIAWAANLVLAILGYVGIMLAVSTLRKIDRQTGYAEAAAEAAAASAHAALMNAQAIINAERSWILITAEPSRSAENSFVITATNRGRTPAKIIESAERVKIAIDDRHLANTPEYKFEKPASPKAPIILLPGESTPIQPFCREDVRGLCDTEERYKRIETWEEKVYLYGRVIYRDLIAPADGEAHQTNWCCWYIHGRQNSGMVVAGPPEYNSHT
ncbi:MAG: hypothetical protein ABSE51_00325 [Terracidiphilus sp.]